MEASKTNGYKELSFDIDHVLNALFGHFNKSSKMKSTLQELQDKLNDAQKTLKRYHKIRWLSRFEVVTTLCDSLESSWYICIILTPLLVLTELVFCMTN